MSDLLTSNLFFGGGVDVVFLNPSNLEGIYQNLANDYAAIEPPTWALLLAQSVRSQGFKTAIIDASAEQLTDDQILARITELNPRLVCFVVYGQNVNAGTASMSGAIRTSNYLKLHSPTLTIAYLGSYVQALPKKALQDELSIDFAFTNEGVYSLWNVLKLPEISQSSLQNLRGIVWRSPNGVVINPPEEVVPNERMDVDLPGYAWDLLPFNETPLDLYRAPMWHAEYDQSKRTPYAALQTSLGCMFSCSFCMINTINRDDDEEIGVSGDYSKMRFWSPEFIIQEFDKLAQLGVRTIRIVDEMFLLNRKYFVPLCEMLAAREYAPELRMWAYSRVDTIKNPQFLNLVRSAGIKWLALGIESAERTVRLEISKGQFEDVDIKKVVNYVHEAGIEVMANYIAGLPGETETLMQATLELSLELCTSGWNMYPAMALPGSQLYKDAVTQGMKLPESYAANSFHAFETLPLGTEYLSAAQVLDFRDRAFRTYHSNEKFLSRIEDRFGKAAREAIIEMNKVILHRKIVEQAAENPLNK
jgi:radical SAM superfamily enzyme YgiQ (UPF0313 family)